MIDLFPARWPSFQAVPQIERQAPVPIGMVFMYAGRPLKVVRVYGEDPAAPVIVEELAAFGTTLRGQYGAMVCRCGTPCHALKPVGRGLAAPPRSPEARQACEGTEERTR